MDGCQSLTYPVDYKMPQMCKFLYIIISFSVRDGVFICLDEKSSFCSTVHNIFQLETTFLLSKLDDQ